MEKRRLNFELPENEIEILEEYCRRTGRTKTEVIRELVRSLSKVEEKPKG